MNHAFSSVSEEALMILFNFNCISMSTSSACTSGIDKRCMFLLICEITFKQANSTVRASYGGYVISVEVETVIVEL